MLSTEQRSQNASNALTMRLKGKTLVKELWSVESTILVTEP